MGNVLKQLYSAVIGRVRIGPGGETHAQDEELKAFIRQTLFEISAGIREANEAYKTAQNSEHNAFLLKPGQGNIDGGGGIHFDVAVTKKTARGAKAHGTVGISVVGVGAGVEGHDSREHVSRIRFTVMIRHYVG